ncbi:hypothetical protein FGU71_07705 [Erythrobacter insulae]|uniref:Small-conductance mechanosensitive channel n=1 Tax=Erythrobacter insulae TaxID=2584124 RepID=A0A547PCA5_9SPHN|nr:mechanosensitive ion channel [Erythrobacter insulae]TRD11762.1 hypothetical protein FGU71_07705 [Erythrobacter insulae]
MQIGNYKFDPELAMQLGEKAVYAIGILIVTWLLAKMAQWAFAKLVDKVSFLNRGISGGSSIGMSLGKIVSLLIWLFGLIAVLQVLELNAVAEPINGLLNTVMGFIPNLVGAALLLIIGLMIAGIVRDIAVTAMQTVNIDKWANKGGVEEVTGNTTVSTTLGTVVYALIAIPVAIGALGVLNIASVSGPATDMLTIVLAAIPNIIAAGVLLGIGYLISRFVVDLLAGLLGGLGFDGPISALGLLPAETKASSVIARVVQIAIILFFAIAATRMLGFPELTAILDEVLALGGSVIFGGLVIAAGFLIANMLGKMLAGAGMAGTVVRYATMLLFAFMGLQFMGVGQEIVQTAFSALVIGLAVAGSLAFGLGGREWAAKKLEQMDATDES